MKKHVVHAALWMLAIGWSGSGAAQAVPNRAAAAADRQDIEGLSRLLRSQTDLAWLFQPSPGKPFAQDPALEAEARSIIRLASVARARHLDREPDMRSALRLLELALLAEAARRDVAASIRVNDDDIRARLAKEPGRYDEFRLSHIFVSFGGGGENVTRTEADARRKAMALRSRIAAGENFADVARHESEDSSTAEMGGELSSMFGRYMADEFFPTARILKQEEVSQPVRGKLGYHLLRLEQRIPATVATARFLAAQDIREERMPERIAAAIRETKP